MPKMKLKSGNSSVFLDVETRKLIQEEGVNLKYLIGMGLKAHTGQLSERKNLMLVNKLSEESQKRHEIQEKFNKILQNLRKKGELVEDWLK